MINFLPRQVRLLTNIIVAQIAQYFYLSSWMLAVSIDRFATLEFSLLSVLSIVKLLLMNALILATIRESIIGAYLLFQSMLWLCEQYIYNGPNPTPTVP